MIKSIPHTHTRVQNNLSSRMMVKETHLQNTRVDLTLRRFGPSIEVQVVKSVVRTVSSRSQVKIQYKFLQCNMLIFFFDDILS